MNKIIYDGRTFAAGDIDTVRMHMATSLISNRLEPNTLTAVVRSADPSITRFVRNTPLTFYHRGKKKFIAYVQTIDRVGPQKYKIYGTSAVGRLMERRHPGGIYTGQTAGEIIDGICGPIPHIVKGNLRSVKLYGWLPYVNPPRSSARDNLSQVLFAIGATVKTDLDGVLHIEGLWDGVSGVLGKERTYKGASVKYTSPVSGVVVTEHQFAEGGDSVKLFEGTTAGNDVITFASPMYNLSATGFTILEQGANYAVLSAGTGTLTGNQYIHNTRQISKNIDGAAEENVKTFSNATLVSLVNSTAVAERMANYYACTETINGDIMIDSQIPGDVVQAYHPHDGVELPSCIESLDVVASGRLKAMAKQVVGFSPAQIEEVTIYDGRILLTGSGNFEVPEGVSSLRLVLIDPGNGGDGGQQGEDGKTYSLIVNSAEAEKGGTWTETPREPGKGGQPGAGGSGGKVLETVMEVSPHQMIPYSAPDGGDGGVINGGKGVIPSIHTRFGDITAENGSSVVNGYIDPITGEKFAERGQPGVMGGSGGKGGNAGLNVADQGNKGEDVKTWVGGSPAKGFHWEYVDGGKSRGGGGGGGGAAYGANGPGLDGKGTVSSIGGASAVAPDTATNIGEGGRGGHGGGGGGSPGGYYYQCPATKNHPGLWITPDTTKGGNGSAGGKGGPGGIIVYYTVRSTIRSGRIMTSDKKFIIDILGRLVIV